MNARATTFHPAVLAQHIAIIGKTGAGKTSTGKLLVEQVVAEGARVCILDPIKSDWWGLTSSADGKKPGLPFHILGGPHGHVPLHSGAGKAIGEIVAAGSLPLSIIDMADFEAGGIQKFFVDFAPALMRHMRGVLYLVLEEAHEFAPKERAGFNAENMAIHFAKKIATAGRSKGIRMIVLTHSVQQLHNRVLGACDTLIAQRLTAPADQKPVLDWLKANVSDKDKQKEIAASLSSLKTGTGWLCAGESENFERVAFPRITTYDNSATPTGDSHAQDVKTAAVDTDKLRAIIGTAVQEAEANDPARLRARIRELEDRARKACQTLVSEVGAEGPMNVDHVAERAALHIRGLEANLKKAEAQQAKTITVAAVTPEDFEEMRRIMTSLLPIIGKAEKALLDAHPAVTITPRPLPGPAPTVYVGGSRTGKTLPRQSTNSNLPPAKQKILNGLAFLHGIGLTSADKTQLALLIGVSPTSGGYFNNLGSLRSEGLIEYPSGGTAALTDSGWAIASTDGVPATTAELHDAIRAKLPPAKWKILEVLISAYPGQLHKDTLADRIGVSSTSGGYFNNLGSLRSLGLIDYPLPGHVVALPVLFLE